MEILSLLRLTIWRIIGLAVIAALAALGTTRIVLNRPAQFETTATVFVGLALPASANPFEIGPRVAEFQTALDLPTVQSQAKTETGLDDSYLNVTSTRQGESSAVKVTSQGADPDGTQAAASAVSQWAIEFMVSGGHDRALQTSASAQAERDRAALTVNQLIEENGSLNPIDEFETAQRQLADAEFAVTNPTLAAADRVAYQRIVDDISGRLSAMAQDAFTYRQANAQLEAAEARFAGAAQQEAEARATFVSATSANVIAIGDPTELSRISSLATGVLAAVLAVFALGIAFFLLYDALTGKGVPIRLRQTRSQREEQAPLSEVPDTFDGAVYPDAVRPISFGTSTDEEARDRRRPGTPTEIHAHEPVTRDRGRRRVGSNTNANASTSTEEPQASMSSPDTVVDEESDAAVPADAGPVRPAAASSLTPSSAREALAESTKARTVPAPVAQSAPTTPARALDEDSRRPNIERRPTPPDPRGGRQSASSAGADATVERDLEMVRPGTPRKRSSDATRSAGDSSATRPPSKAQPPSKANAETNARPSADESSGPGPPSNGKARASSGRRAPEAAKQTPSNRRSAGRPSDATRAAESPAPEPSKSAAARPSATGSRTGAARKSTQTNGTSASRPDREQARDGDDGGPSADSSRRRRSRRANPSQDDKPS